MKTKILTILCIVLTKLSFGQYQQYEQYLTPFLSAPIESGFFYFTTPNNIQAGQLYNWYKINAPDPDNSMWLIDEHVDSLAHFKHFKYQQAYKNIPIEGAGCIEHYDTNGSLSFINAKIADSINKNPVPAISDKDAIASLIKILKKADDKIQFAWESVDWENQIKIDQNNDSATWFPTAKLIWAIDTLKNVQLVIPGNRYNLAYKISITTINPKFETISYYFDANNEVILKERPEHIAVSGDVYGYGNRNLDTKWRGGFIQKYELDAEDSPHNYHTKKWAGDYVSWNNMPDTRSSASNWGSTYLSETSTHFHVGNTWDYFFDVFGRNGLNNAGAEVRVKTQYNQVNAYYNGGVSPNELVFGKSSTGWDLGMDPTIVAHEFTHGITRHTSNLAYEYESGALNESFSDIFGITVPAKTLDNGNTNWIVGNKVSNSIEHTRSLSEPQSRGQHWTGNFVNGYMELALGQPDYYQGQYWCTNCTGDQYGDYGGVHINSGVQNKWFYLLSVGSSNPSFPGIGMTKASRIAYFALTSLLMSSSQYTDSKEATVIAARILYGDCSAEHISTVEAWKKVGIYGSYDCAPLSIDKINFDQTDILLYPNPTNNFITIELPISSKTPIQIFDINGKLVQEVENDQLVINTDVSSLTNGVYLIHLELNNQQIVKRLIIQK